MARKGWGQLSSAYRERLERGGISRSSYESGASLARARGHGSTPERQITSVEGLEQATAGRYRSYAEVRLDIIDLKTQIYGTAGLPESSYIAGRMAEMAGKSQATLAKARMYLEEMLINDYSWDEMQAMYPELEDDEWDWLGYYH